MTHHPTSGQRGGLTRIVHALGVALLRWAASTTDHPGMSARTPLPWEVPPAKPDGRSGSGAVVSTLGALADPNRTVSSLMEYLGHVVPDHLANGEPVLLLPPGEYEEQKRTVVRVLMGVANRHDPNVVVAMPSRYPAKQSSSDG